MAKLPRTPTTTKSEFDRIKTDLRESLRKWWEDEAQSFDAAIAGTAQVWEGLPEIDSKAVVKASPVVRRFLGAELDPKMIRKGGYSSFDDMADDLLKKLRDTCPLTAPSSVQSVQDSVESVNARRR